MGLFTNILPSVQFGMAKEQITSTNAYKIIISSLNYRNMRKGQGWVRVEVAQLGLKSHNGNGERMNYSSSPL